MSTANVSSRGRITIPADVRRALNLHVGDRLEIVQVGTGRFEVIAVTRSIRELKGMFGKSRRTVPIEEMNFTMAGRGLASRRAGTSAKHRTTTATPAA